MSDHGSAVFVRRKGYAMSSMKITKFGQASLLIEVENNKLLIDPGTYSTGDESVTGLSAVWVTHAHPDHCDPTKIHRILTDNPQATLYTTSEVIEKLGGFSHAAILVEDGQTYQNDGLDLTAIGRYHSALHASIPPIENVGCLVNHRFFYPGDNLTPIEDKVEILALPVAGPWLKLSEAIDYAISLKPKVCFPVHDGILKQAGTTDRIPGDILPRHGITWKILELTLPNEM